MTTVTLRDDLQELLLESAAGQDLEKLVNRAVEQYLLSLQREKLDREIHTFESMHAELLRQHLAECVAIYNGQLVEHGPDKSEVVGRVRSRFGRAPVLIRQVTESPRRALWFRSPRLERGLS